MSRNFLKAGIKKTVPSCLCCIRKVWRTQGLKLKVLLYKIIFIQQQKIILTNRFNEKLNLDWTCSCDPWHRSASRRQGLSSRGEGFPSCWCEYRKGLNKMKIRFGLKGTALLADFNRHSVFRMKTWCFRVFAIQTIFFDNI